jgi:hypothetical protein
MPLVFVTEHSPVTYGGHLMEQVYREDEVIEIDSDLDIKASYLLKIGFNFTEKYILDLPRSSKSKTHNRQ